jgi:hypothetical protein
MVERGSFMTGGSMVLNTTWVGVCPPGSAVAGMNADEASDISGGYVSFVKICATFPRVIETTSSLCRLFFSISGDIRGISCDQSLVANFEYPSSDPRDWVRTSMRLVRCQPAPVSGRLKVRLARQLPQPPPRSGKGTCPARAVPGSGDSRRPPRQDRASTRNPTLGSVPIPAG